MRAMVLALLASGILLTIPGTGAPTTVPVSSRAQWRALGGYRVMGYCPCARCCGKADGTYAPTSLDRVVAAPRGFPFGAKLWIEGVGLVTVGDRGGAIKGKRLDVFFRTHREARDWGVRKLKVFAWAKPSVN